MKAIARRTFLEQYATVRHSEGRGSADREYYLALPYADLSGRNAWQWKIRACTFDFFIRRVIEPEEKRLGRSLRILDVGAGNGWLSWRLRQRGHDAVPVDIFTDQRDGLGAIPKYTELPAVAADFDQLPFGAETFDLIVYNASFHYSSDYRATLEQARHCLRAGGQIAILDSPLYQRRQDGERMKSEREAVFEKTYGFRSNALGSIEYLDEDTLTELSNQLALQWKRAEPWYGLQWALRPWKARLKGSRPPSRFVVLTGTFR